MKDVSRSADWDVALQQVKAYKSYKEETKKKKKVRSSLEKEDDDTSASFLTSTARTKTTTTKQREDEESVRAYREWKDKQQREAMRENILLLRSKNGKGGQTRNGNCSDDSGEGGGGGDDTNVEARDGGGVTSGAETNVSCSAAPSSEPEPREHVAPVRDGQAGETNNKDAGAAAAGGGAAGGKAASSSSASAAADSKADDDEDESRAGPAYRSPVPEEAALARFGLLTNVVAQAATVGGGVPDINFDDSSGSESDNEAAPRPEVLKSLSSVTAPLPASSSSSSTTTTTTTSASSAPAKQRPWPAVLSDASTSSSSLPPLPVHDAEVLQDVLSNRSVRLRVVTWNQQAKAAPPDDGSFNLSSSLFCGTDRFHIIAVGTEECENTIAKSLVVSSKRNWEYAVTKSLGERYVKVRGHTLQATHLIVFVHRALVPLISRVESAAVATGFDLGTPATGKQQMGNKGGVGIALHFGDSKFVFVNAHLAAHQKEVDKRNEEFSRISAGLAKELGEGEGKGSVFSENTAAAHLFHSNPLLSQFDQVFWSGDMNYRINGTRRVVDVLLEKEMHEVLLNNDQLKLSMATNHTFDGFAEGPLNFRPTYKFDKGSDVYDSSKKQRIPSWTDRILYKKGEDGWTELINYGSVESIKTSDHRPVYASFNAKFNVGGHEGADSPGSGSEGSSVRLGQQTKPTPVMGDTNASQVCAIM